MDWLNIHRTTLGSGQFLGCEPVQRATWLCLLAYCADQENGGRIEGAESWGDRKWQQIARVTYSEVHDDCPLWSWDGADLVVWAYPAEKEAEVRRNRENGGRGGRPRKPEQNHLVISGLTHSETEIEPPATISAETEQERNRKGNRKGKEEQQARRAGFAPPSEQEWVEYCAATWSDWHPVCAGEAWAYYQGVGWVVGRKPCRDWKATARTAHGNARQWGKLQPQNQQWAPQQPQSIVCRPGELDGIDIASIGRL